MAANCMVTELLSNFYLFRNRWIELEPGLELPKTVLEIVGFLNVFVLPYLDEVGHGGHPHKPYFPSAGQDGYLRMDAIIIINRFLTRFLSLEEVVRFENGKLVFVEEDLVTIDESSRFGLLHEDLVELRIIGEDFRLEKREEGVDEYDLQEEMKWSYDVSTDRKLSIVPAIRYKEGRYETYLIVYIENEEKSTIITQIIDRTHKRNWKEVVNEMSRGVAIREDLRKSMIKGGLVPYLETVLSIQQSKHALITETKINGIDAQRATINLLKDYGHAQRLEVFQKGQRYFSELVKTLREEEDLIELLVPIIRKQIRAAVNLLRRYSNDKGYFYDSNLVGGDLVSVIDALKGIDPDLDQVLEELYEFCEEVGIIG